MRIRNRWSALALVAVCAGTGCKITGHTSWGSSSGSSSRPSSSGSPRSGGAAGSDEQSAWWAAQQQQTARENAEVAERKQREATCKVFYDARRHPERAGPDNPERTALLMTLCEDGDARSYVLRHMDRGRSSPIFFATLTTFCEEKPEYYAWRECRDFAAQADPKVLTQAIEKATPDPFVRRSVPAIYEYHRQRLEAAAPAMETLVLDYPGLALLYDDARRQVEEEFVPRFRQWQAKLAAVDDWVEKIRQGPRFIGTCREDLTALLQSYVQSRVPRPDKDRLFYAFQDQIGYPIAAALAVCLKNLDDQLSFEKLSYFLVHAGRSAGEHSALVSALAQLQPRDGKKEYKGKRWIPSRTYQGSYEVWLDRLIEAPWVNNVKTSEVKDEVASLTRKGNQVLVKFKKVKAKATFQEGCRQTNRVIRIEPNGTVVYELVGCRWVTETVDRTERDVWLPAEEAAALGVGYTVALRVDSTTASRKAFLLWAKDKSGGAVWASGFTPGSVAAGAAKR